MPGAGIRDGLSAWASGRPGRLALGAGRTHSYGRRLPECHAARPTAPHAPARKTRVGSSRLGPRFGGKLIDTPSARRTSLGIRASTDLAPVIVFN